jgi:hypothetical protein
MLGIVVEVKYIKLSKFIIGLNLTIWNRFEFELVFYITFITKFKVSSQGGF